MTERAECIWIKLQRKHGNSDSKALDDACDQIEALESSLSQAVQRVEVLEKVVAWVQLQTCRTPEIHDIESYDCAEQLGDCITEYCEPCYVRAALTKEDQ